MRTTISYLLIAFLSLSVGSYSLQADSPKQSYDRGYKRHMQGRHKDAVKHYSKAVEKNPSYVLAYQMRAAAWHTLKEYEYALLDYGKVIELGDDTFKAVAHFNRGLVQYDLGRYKAAIVDFSWAVSYNPRITMAYVQRGLAKGRMGDKKGKVKDFVYAARYGDSEVRKWLEKHAPHVLERK